MTDERWKECCHHHHGCACREHQWEEKVAKLEAEVFRLKGETYCAYCGARFLLDAPDATKRIGQHIAECLKHPMRIIEIELGVSQAEVTLLKAEVERLKGDRSAWAARSQEQFDRIGVALERVREHRESGEPSRDDATEVEALVGEVECLRVERDSLRIQLDQMAKVIASDTRRMLGLDGYRHE